MTPTEIYLIELLTPMKMFVNFIAIIGFILSIITALHYTVFNDDYPWQEKKLRKNTMILIIAVTTLIAIVGLLIPTTETVQKIIQTNENIKRPN